MSHVDEGILHAYLDGELAPVEAERLEAHLAGCDACRARLAEERALIERASKLLGRTAPPLPARAAPPLHELRHPGLVWRIRTPLAWAATVVLALGIGWYTRGTLLLSPKTEMASPESNAIEPPAAVISELALDSGSSTSAPTHRTAPWGLAEPAQRRAVTVAEEESAPRRDVPSAVTETGARAGSEIARAERDEQPPDAKTADQLPQPRAQVEVRGAAPAPVPTDRIVITNAAPGVVSGERSRLSTAWPVISSEAARPILGGQPATIPGLAIRDIRRDPFGEPVVLVEQLLDSGIVIQLYQRRADQAAASVGRLNQKDSPAGYADARAPLVKERLARFIGALRVEIAGPLPMDSLSRLLELVR